MPLPCHGLFLPPHPSRIINSLKQDTANNDIADRAAPATPHPTDIHHRSPPTTSPQSPLLTTSRRNNPPKKSPLRPRSHRPRPPRPGQKQSNHTFPLPGSRGCYALCDCYRLAACAARTRMAETKARFTKARRRCRNALLLFLVTLRKQW